jgi:RNA polymerase sigma-70 factor (ECF subfamily)
VFRKLGSFRGSSLFSTWLFRIVVNCSIDLRRRTRVGRWPALLTDDGSISELEDAAPGPREHAALRETGDQVQAAISMLSPKLRVILALRYLEEMSYEELAATLDLSMGTVKSRLARAHLALEKVVRTRFPQLDISKRLDADAAGGAAGDSVGGVG